MKDVIIIGGGPAGMTAAIYAARKALDQVFISPYLGGQAAWAGQIENFLVYPYVTGTDLALQFQDHIDHFNVNHVADTVSGIVKNGQTFIVTTEGGEQFEGKCVIVTAGRTARTLGVPGEQEFKGKGVSYCATCDAPLYKGKDVAVVGGGNAGVDAAIQLARIANHVYLIESTPRLNADKKYQENLGADSNATLMLRTEVNSMHGNQFLESIVVRNLDTDEQQSIPVGGIFVEIGSMPSVHFLPPEVEVNKRGEIVVDCECHTNLDGLFAAGDVTSIPFKQIIIAAGEGAKALLSANSYLIRTFPRRPLSSS